ncbi:hypothetical protein Pla22_39320 [Rubripirellula amarantea]|uniref:Secreted protein n=1 Tax=Rubripirellula amarantea TaxID=2527999 RepID=A0A5C5WLV9_9BACT|nr:hypothetical protein Pla22_39320 [Rubripirellula amarantea]
MKFVSQRFLGLILASTVAVCVLSSDAVAQNETHIDYSNATVSVPATSAPTHVASSVPQYSADQQHVAHYPAPMATGSGCASGNCGGSVIVSSSPVVSPASNYQSFASPSFSVPVHTTYSAAPVVRNSSGCASGTCGRARKFSHRHHR